MCIEVPHVQMNHERALVQILLENGTARERKRLWKTFPQSFRGSDAIRVWLSSGLVESIEDAVIEGTLLMKMGLVRHVTGRKDFENSHTLFVVAKCGSLAVKKHNEKKLMTDEDFIAAIKDNGLARSRRFRLRRYDNCFVASEAVKMWVAAGYAENTAEAVATGQHLLEKGFIGHVGGMSHFENAKLLFRISYVDSNEPDDMFPMRGQFHGDRLSVTQRFGGSLAPKRAYEKTCDLLSDSDENVEEPFSLQASIGRRFNDLARTFSMDFANNTPEDGESPVPFFEDRTVPFFQPVPAQ
eukprot:Plantae.Rhodophyta-Purpureofilum_apyrenoidigerum.ctg5228.p1 GENE.Plantae.Rhodophyta-Purpureofilum_apyrenoidigerum.ctg5228~~Plantae.Rhodophyta-Purpureofilum_apyrenoidigerum.ctg5228.p1  ORF type:complete len:298 (-),score=59.02 Plantae.Rhodophyta-Purpureofilum_apyrenoidigerum.ctg5228:218-1111(-)